MRHLSLLAIVLSLPACAGEMAMRSVSSQSAGILNQYRTVFRNFAARQTESNAANASRIHRINDLRDQRTSEIQSRTRAWRVAGKETYLSSFSILTATNAESIISSLASAPEASAAAGLRFDPAPVDAVIKQLVEIQRPRSTPDRARDLLGFATKVRESFDSAVAAASARARTAQNATSDNTNQTETGALSPPAGEN